MDHRLDINNISRRIYKIDKWPIDINHRWILMATNNKGDDLYGAYLEVRIKIGNMEVK